MRWSVVALCVPAAVSMPGCVAWEIRDEMRRTNEQLETRLAMLERTNDLLAGIKTDLDETKAELGTLKASLTTTNESMADVQKRLAVLEPIEKSLDSLDESLKTVKSLIEKIPFVGSSDEEEKEKEQPPAEKPADGEKPKES